ncbi:MAG: carboxypeptidase regulatory-like domain-containing protein [Rhodospirillales bacterium]|jgi:nickel transport protein|nr:carboxypeptidase regulatory-like domain-containing protein [Rhodospirillales bacterium]
MLRFLAIVLAITLGWAPSASAHKLSLFAMAEGTEIVGKVAFAGGAPATGAKVRIEGPDGTVLHTVAVDAEGTFRFQVTQRMDHVVVADTGDGHAERAEVHWENFPDSLPMAKGRIAIEGDGDHAHEHAHTDDQTAQHQGTTDQIEKAIARQIGPLRMELAAYQDEIRFRDVIGGVGYIVGIAGLLAWFHTRRKRMAA